MHEASLIAAALEMARDAARRHAARRIERITVRVGRAAGVEPDALNFAFEALRGEDDLTAIAELVIEPAPVRCKCAKCMGEFAPPGDDWRCPACSDSNVELLSGRELDLVGVEVV